MKMNKTGWATLMVILAVGMPLIFAGCSGGGEATEYKITVDTAIPNGEIIADRNRAGDGKTITLTITPNDGYELETLTINDTAVNLSDVVDGKYTFRMPKGDVTVSGTFKAEGASYTVTVTPPTNGSITIAGGKTSFAAGETVTLTITPASGYELNTITATGGATITGTGNTRTFTMPAANVTVSGTFQTTGGDPTTYPVTIDSTITNGTITIEGSKTSFAEGETVTLIVTPDDNYQRDTLTMNGTAIIGNTFTMPAAPVTVTGTFILATVTYTVTIDPTITNGTITANHTTNVAEGTTVTLTIEPDAGYELDTLTMNGTAVSGASNTSRTFTMPAADVTVVGTFKVITYTVTVTPPVNGTIVADKNSAAEGETVTLTITPNANYVLDTLTMNGTAVSGASTTSRTFTMPSANATVVGTFSAILYTVNVLLPDTPPHGTIVASKTSGAIVGETITLTITPEAGYELSTLKMNGVEVPGVSKTSRTFTMPAANATVVGTFALITYYVNFDPDMTDGTVTATPASGPIGTPIQLVATATSPDTHRYVADSLSAVDADDNAIGLIKGGNRANFVMPASNVTVTADFEARHLDANKYDITIGSFANGTVTSDPEDEQWDGDSVTLTVTPDAGYRLDTLTVTKTDATTVMVSDLGAECSFTMPDDDVTVAATFVETTAAITVNFEAPNETIYLTPVSALGWGGTLIVSAPLGGYAPYAWYLDGVVQVGETEDTFEFEIPRGYAVGKHTVTVVGKKDNVPYSNTLTFTVER